MRKVELTAAFWTMVLAIPFTVLALSLAAFTTEHLSEIISWINNFSHTSTVGGRGWLIVLAERWPEIAGMFVGQVILLIILIFARQEAAENQETTA